MIICRAKGRKPVDLRPGSACWSGGRPAKEVGAGRMYAGFADRDRLPASGEELFRQLEQTVIEGMEFGDVPVDGRCHVDGIFRAAVGLPLCGSLLDNGTGLVRQNRVQSCHLYVIVVKIGADCVRRYFVRTSERPQTSTRARAGVTISTTPRMAAFCTSPAMVPRSSITFPAVSRIFSSLISAIHDAASHTTCLAETAIP